MAFSERIKGVPKSGIREIFDLAQLIPDALNLGIGEPDIDTPSFVRKAAGVAIESGFTHYTANSGIPELRQEIAKKMKRENGVDVDPSKEVIVTAGATQAIFVLMNCLLNEGEEVLLPTPLFTAYRNITRLAGGKPIEVAMDEREDYDLDVNKIKKAWTSHTKVVVINSPCNPTGAVLSKKGIEEVCEFAVSKGLYVVSDEIYEKFLYEGATHFSPASKNEFKKHVITVNGFSKTYAMTGWRLGYAVANSDVIDAMIRYNMYNAVCASSFVQVAGVAALRHSLSFFGPILKEFAKRRKAVCDGLEKLGFAYSKPMGAFYVFPELLGLKIDSMTFSKQLLSKQHVATVPGSSFGEGGEGHIRMSYAQSVRTLQTALEKIGKYKRELEKGA